MVRTLLQCNMAIVSFLVVWAVGTEDPKLSKTRMIVWKCVYFISCLCCGNDFKWNITSEQLSYFIVTRFEIDLYRPTKFIYLQQIQNNSNFMPIGSSAFSLKNALTKTMRINLICSTDTRCSGNSRRTEFSILLNFNISVSKNVPTSKQIN